MANFAKTHIGNESRVELHEVLGLTGAEVSVNNLPAGAGVAGTALCSAGSAGGAGRGGPQAPRRKSQILNRKGRLPE